MPRELGPFRLWAMDSGLAFTSCEPNWLLGSDHLQPSASTVKNSAMSFYEILSTCALILAPFTLLERFPGENRKQKIAEYIFGIEEIKFGAFETNTIRFLMGIFIKEGRVRPVLVFTRLSLIGALLGTFFYGANLELVSLYYTIGRPSTVSVEFLLLMLGIFIGLSCFGFPIDLLSLKVTKALFVDRKPNTIMLAPTIVLDCVLSLALPALFVILSQIIALFFGSWHVFPSDAANFYFVEFMTLGLLSVAFFGALSLGITAIQVVVLIVGVFVRCIMAFTRLNSFVAMHSEIYHHPFTFVGLVLSVITGLTLSIAT